MKILVIQHTAVDSAAAAGEFFDRAGHAVQTLRLDRGDTIPDQVDFDALATFGGPVTLFDPQLPSWVAQEQSLIRRFADQGRHVLGICLGAQMLATALGGQVRRNQYAEVGWHRIEKVENTSASVLDSQLPPELTVLQWHQNTFDLPDGATHLYQSKACRNQAFMVTDRVLGFQFHLEADATTVRNFTMVSKLCRQPGRYVQSVLEIRDGVQLYLADQTRWMNQLLSQWLSA